MMRELTEQDFARAVKNPHFDKLMTKVEVAITKEDWATFCEAGKINGVPPELIMRYSYQRKKSANFRRFFL